MPIHMAGFFVHYANIMTNTYMRPGTICLDQMKTSSRSVKLIKSSATATTVEMKI